jgi:hypothetical protein
MKMFKVSILAILFSSVSISGALAEEVFFSCKYSHYADDSLEIFKAENFDLQFIWRDDGIAVIPYVLDRINDCAQSKAVGFFSTSITNSCP